MAPPKRNLHNGLFTIPYSLGIVLGTREFVSDTSPLGDTNGDQCAYSAVVGTSIKQNQRNCKPCHTPAQMAGSVQNSRSQTWNFALQLQVVSGILV